jgi:phage gp36-like protein
MFHSVSSFLLVAFPSGSFNSIPTAVIQNALDVAESKILTYCRHKHSLPFDTGSYGQSSELAILYDAQVTMAAYNLMDFRGSKPNVNGALDEVLEKRYDEITHPEIGLLAQIAQGRILLPGSSDSTPTTTEGRMKSYGSEGRTTRYYSDDGKEYIR